MARVGNTAVVYGDDYFLEEDEVLLTSYLGKEASYKVCVI